MKHKIFLLIIFIFLAIAGFSQGFKGGLIAGLSASQISGDNLSGYNKAGIYAGGFVKLKLKEKFGFQMELAYIQKGSKKNANPDKGDYKSYKLSLQYVEMPFIFQYYFRPKLTFEGGLFYGVFINSKEQDEYGVISVGTNYPKFKKGEFGGQISVAYNITDKWTVNLRLSNSFLKVREHAGGGTYHLNKGQYNDLLMFSFRYQFGDS
ncbi:MAG: PorT family protein [Saprospiraceae bacterium]|nr:PorT family protein [Saprospiraceae bacterium]